jgi:hypothetical protein
VNAPWTTNASAVSPSTLHPVWEGGHMHYSDIVKLSAKPQPRSGPQIAKHSSGPPPPRRLGTTITMEFPGTIVLLILILKYRHE